MKKDRTNQRGQALAYFGIFGLVSRTRSPLPNSGAARRRWLRCSSSE